MSEVLQRKLNFYRSQLPKYETKLLCDSPNPHVTTLITGSVPIMRPHVVTSSWQNIGAL